MSSGTERVSTSPLLCSTSTVVTSLKKRYLFQKDKIKFIVFAVLAIVLISALLIVGKEHVIMKYVSGACLAIWLVTMFVINKKFK